MKKLEVAQVVAIALFEEMMKNGHTLVPDCLIDYFVTFAHSKKVYPSGGAYILERKSQVFYIDRF
jgi:hypothetical protein